MTSRKPHWWRPWSGEASWRAQARKTASALDKETFLTWLDGGGAEAANLTFGEVWNRSAVMASWLFDVGLNTGERAMLVYAPGPEFFVAFVACLRAGILAVPNYPPDPAKLSRDLEKLDLVCTTCTAKVGLADNVVYALQLATRMWHSWPRIEWYNTDDIKGDERLSTESRFTLSEDTLADEIIKHLRTSDFSSALAEEDPHSQDNDDDELAFARASLRASIHEQECQRDLDDKRNVERRSRVLGGKEHSGRRRLDRTPNDSVAFLQFTSGSTGDPKGVMVSHNNIWHNVNECYLPGQHHFLGCRMGKDTIVRLHDLAEPSTRVVGVSWLPQFHDSGLILMLLGPFLAGYHQRRPVHYR